MALARPQPPGPAIATSRTTRNPTAHAPRSRPQRPSGTRMAAKASPLIGPPCARCHPAARAQAPVTRTAQPEPQQRPEHAGTHPSPAHAAHAAQHERAPPEHHLFRNPTIIVLASTNSTSRRNGPKTDGRNRHHQCHASKCSHIRMTDRPAAAARTPDRPTAIQRRRRPETGRRSQTAAPVLASQVVQRRIPTGTGIRRNVIPSQTTSTQPPPEHAASQSPAPVRAS